MKSKRLNHQCLDHQQILSKVKNQMARSTKYEKIEESFHYLNNSFHNNIQIQEIFIDLCKAKNKNIKFEELKTMYKIFTENKANLCIFQKIVNKQDQNRKKNIVQKKYIKQAKNGKGLTQIIEVHEQIQTQKKIDDPCNANISHDIKLQPGSLSNENKSTGNHKLYKNTKITHNDLIYDRENQREIKILMQRICIRLIEKIIVKIVFYTMNDRFLNFLARNHLDLTKNLEKIIRDFNHIKDLNLLQQTILKILKQNAEIQNKIYEVLVDDGYIASIDEFYRINGLDTIHNDVFQKFQVNQPDIVSKSTVKLKTELTKLEQQTLNVVKKTQIDKTNKLLNQKYQNCIAQIKNISLKFADSTPSDNNLASHKPQKQFQAKQKRKTLFPGFKPSLITEKAEKSHHSFSGSEKILIKSNHIKQSQKQYKSKLSIFSSDFAQTIKKMSSQNSTTQKNFHHVTQKFVKLYDLKEAERNSAVKIRSDNQKFLHKLIQKKSFQEMLSFSVNKLLKLYETKHLQNFSIKKILGQDADQLQMKIQEASKDQISKINSLVQKENLLFNQKEAKQKFEKENQTVNQLKKTDLFLQTRISQKNKTSANRILVNGQKNSKQPFQRLMKNQQNYQNDHENQPNQQNRKNRYNKLNLKSQQFTNYPLNIVSRNTNRIKIQTCSQTKMNFFIFTDNGIEDISFNQTMDQHIMNRTQIKELSKNEKIKQLNQLSKFQKQSQSPFMKQIARSSTPINIYKQKSQQIILRSSYTQLRQPKAQQESQETEKKFLKQNEATQKILKIGFVSQKNTSSLSKTFDQVCQNKANQYQRKKEEEKLKRIMPSLFDKKFLKDVTKSKLLKFTSKCVSSPISPKNKKNKEKSQLHLYEIYDIRNRRKLFK